MTEKFEANLKQLIARRERLFRRVQFIYDLIVDLPHDKTKLENFKVRYDDLTKTINEFEKTQEEIYNISLIIDPKLDKDPTVSSTIALEEMYYKVIGAYQQFCAVTVTSSVTANPKKLVRPRLPELNLPTFDGTLVKWSSFFDNFKSLIHNNEQLTDIEKFHYLLSSLSGPALSVAQSLPITENNYAVVWKALLERYDNKRLLGTSLLDSIFNYKPTINESASTLNYFLSNFNEPVTALKSLKIPDLADFIILFIALRTLPVHTRKQFEIQQIKTEFPTFEDLSKFIQNQARILEISEKGPQAGNSVNEKHVKKSPYIPTKSNFNYSRAVSKPTVSYTVTEVKQSNNSNRCVVCKKPHSIFKCQEFQSLNPEKRKEVIQNLKLCFNCLKNTHFSGSCPSKTNCLECGSRHHTLLHFGTYQTPAEPQAVSVMQNHSSNNITTNISQNETRSNLIKSNCQTSSNLQSKITNSCTTVLLGTALIHIKDYNNSFQPVRAMIDSGAQNSFITSKCANRLGLSRKICNISVTGLAENSVTDTKGIVTCHIKPRDSEHVTFTTEAIILPRITQDMPTLRIPSEVCEKFKHIFLADPEFDKPAKIDFLIAGDLFPFIYDGQHISGNQDIPSALHSIFGWVITGKIQLSAPQTSLITSCLTSLSSLDMTLRKFWEIEEIPRLIPEGKEDAFCEEMFVKKHYRNQDGRYVVPILKKDSELELGDSYQTAMTRLQAIDRRLLRQPELKQEYSTFMQEYFALGHMEMVSENKSSLNTNFIPHHCVIKDTSSTTRVRVVFDASVKTTSGVSLNDTLHIGPKLQKDIREIILRFRLKPYVITADIRQMYRQIFIIPEDRHLQHILWHNSTEEAVQEYELKTITYGLSSSPFLAQRTVRQLALDEGHNFPLTVPVLLNDIYMDDILAGAYSIEDLLQLQQQLIQIFAKGGFELRKWTSNHPTLLERLPEDQRESPLLLDSQNQKVVKILGLQWTAALDTFSYRIEAFPLRFTKRSILSHIARIYDPLGYLSPVIIKMKCLIQNLWQLGLDWDSTLPTPIQQEWEIITSQLATLAEIQINRFVLTEEKAYYQNNIVGFCDASERAYGAAIYLVVGNMKTTFKASLLIAKSKVAPLKTISIPRLELCGALLLARLIKHVNDTYSGILTIHQTYLFTDSTTVLSWLRTSPNRLKMYVANRVTEILDLTPPDRWNHIGTLDNPADCASRGIYPQVLINHKLWWTGPLWLKLPADHWPVKPPELILNDDLPEVKPVAMHTGTSEPKPFPLLILDRFSSLTKLLRVTALCFRFVNNSRTNNKVTGFISTTELVIARQHWIREIQEFYFKSDIHLIRKNSNPSAKIIKLNPFIDSLGLLRVGGRLKNANISEQQKYPILLPKSGHFTDLIIDHYHKLYLHIGPRSLQSIIQREFWIISIRRAIRHRLTRCLPCLKTRAVSLPPRMGDLPFTRVNPAKPFTNVGIDFGGPFPIKETPRRNSKTLKAYLCLFICMCTKAVHLELVSDLTTEAFLAAFHRFVARRGICLNVFTDCGTNFVGAARYFKEFYKTLRHSTDFLNVCSQQNITWNFNPPIAPHFGGLWEAGIRSAKTHLKRVVGTQILTFEELTTLFARIEAVLNSRPLCSLSTDPSEIDVLTPGHFLTGSPLVTLPENDYTEIPINRLKRWQLIQQAAQHFWNRWKTEYLNSLQQRLKWTKDSPNLRVGDMVLIKEKRSPVLQWSLGRIERTYPGTDDRVRVVLVRTPSGTIRRPVIQLVPLPSGEAN